jgi:hypothetical protein
MDLSALGSVDTNVKSQGQFAVDYNVDGDTKTISVTVTNFQPPGGFNAQDQAIRPPRSGSYVFTRTVGKGGSLKFQEQVDLLCPANPSKAAADVSTVARWTHDPTTGDLVGRADAQATGGQIPTGDKWEGVTCFDLSKDDGTGLSAETYWMMKDEDSSGTSVHYFQANGATACASEFGAVPDTNDATNDFNFTTVNFTDTSVVPFPGQ